MKTRSQLIATLVATAVTGLLVTGCGRNDDGRTVGQQVDSAIAKTEQKAEEARAEVKQDVNDATITASVNAELARDPGLSAVRIDVDTANGNVALKGTAPDAAAKDRATQLAAAVKGVNGVDNQLVVSQ